MLTTHSPSPREAGPAAKFAGTAPRRATEPSPLDPTVWQQVLQAVRAQHPSLNRVWFDQLVPRQLTNGVIQVTVATPAQLNFCQGQCQQPFTSAAQQITGRLVARIEKPCYETRVAILQKKARMRGLTLPEDVVCYIAGKVENNTRELEGAITKIQGMGLLQAGAI
ncbi:MAG: hypothetical protein LC642_04315, partial [Verrucomicrobiaceae bacterium]|nr:hypothetical protein [Verrucomicrobiaceae bacterium]